MKKKKPTKSLRDQIEELRVLWEKIILSPAGIALTHWENTEVRQKKFAQIMKRQLGPKWEDELMLDFSAIPTGGTMRRGDLKTLPYGEMAGATNSVMLEKLDRSGRLVDGLTPGDVQIAAQHEIDAWTAGKLDGKALASIEARSELLKKDLLFGSPICVQLAELFGVEDEYKAKGDSWLDGFRSGVAAIWWPIRQKA